MVEQIDTEKKRLMHIWTLDDVQNIIDDMAANGYEYRPPLTEDEKFEALKAAKTGECGSLSFWSIMDALDKLYLKRQVMTDGEGHAITVDDAVA